jgi:hypothetical protein
MMSGTHVCRFGMRRKLAQSGNGKKRWLMAGQRYSITVLHTVYC